MTNNISRRCKRDANDLRFPVTSPLPIARIILIHLARFPHQTPPNLKPLQKL